MIKEIKFTGLRHQPSAYDCQDGTLDYVANAVNENGYITSIDTPNEVLDLSKFGGHEVLYIHKENYILRVSDGDAEGKKGKLQYWQGNISAIKSFPDNAPSFTKSEIVRVTSIGNTLIVITSQNKYYFLWKYNAYAYLGTSMPELTLSFGLDTYFAYGVTNSVWSDKYDGSLSQPVCVSKRDFLVSDTRDGNVENAKSILTDAVMAKVNMLIDDDIKEKGYFVFPFFVRYAYRLYDGSLFMHSAPILMVPSSEYTPLAVSALKTYNDYLYELSSFYIGVLRSKLTYGTYDDVDFTDWKDIIKSVDIFITDPIYTYDASEKISSVTLFSDENVNNKSNSICRFTSAGKNETGVFNHDLRSVTQQFVTRFHYASDNMCFIDLPKRSAGKIEEDIKNASTFYFLKSIKIESLHKITTKTASNGDEYLDLKEIEIDNGYLNFLQTQEVMTDDYESHDTIIPTYAFPYNGRMNYANIKKRLFNGFDTRQIFPVKNSGLWTMLVELEIEGRTIVLESNIPAIPYVPYIYYPSSFAKNIYFITGIGGTQRIVTGDPTQYIGYKFQLTPSDFLNGAYCFTGWRFQGEETTQFPITSAIQNNFVHLPNKLYTSLVNNPFVLPAKGINSIGQSEILGISTAAKALSEGQFGQFPLYVFSDEGIWAMEVSNDGWFTVKQPISREVCINEESITQLDGAVLFFTDKGLMLLEGSDVVCISDELDNITPFQLNDLPNSDVLKSIYGETLNEGVVSPVEYMKGANMLYDYRNQRIYIQNPNFEYGYVRSLKTKLWSTQTIFKIINTLNSYPGGQATIRYNGSNDSDRIADFSNITPDNTPKALLITRPLKLDLPDTFKTVERVIQRGNFEPGHVQQILYGSNDLVTWRPLASSKNKYISGLRGYSYKYFRLALFMDLAKGESLTGCTIQFTEKGTNKLR